MIDRLRNAMRIVLGLTDRERTRDEVENDAGSLADYFRARGLTPDDIDGLIDWLALLSSAAEDSNQDPSLVLTFALGMEYERQARS